MADSASNATAAAGPDDAPTRDMGATRRKWLIRIAGIVLLAAIVWGVWYLLVASHYVETDNAYVGADTAQITPMVAGQVVEVLKSDTDSVKRGDVLIRLDDSDARIALASAEAELVKARRQFGQSSATNAALSAQVQARGADIQSARAQLTTARAAYRKAQIDYDRRKGLVAGGAVSGDELTSVTNALAAARGAVQQAQAAVNQASSTQGAAAANLAANNALIQGVSASDSPDVLTAQARVQQAQLDLARTIIRAPVDGVITGRAVQVGQRVAPGAVVMRVVPIGQAYVDANFKEGQLAKVKIGQPVVLSSDLYGSGVKFHGRVAGFSGGTGSSFALIPAQNATGNWIKVIQRLPVRVKLDPKELAQHPLRVGLSMKAEIDISGQ